MYKYLCTYLHITTFIELESNVLCGLSLIGFLRKTKKLFYVDDSLKDLGELIFIYQIDLKNL